MVRFPKGKKNCYVTLLLSCSGKTSFAFTFNTHLTYGTIKLVAVGDRNPVFEAALEFHENDLPSPHVVDVELL